MSRDFETFYSDYTHVSYNFAGICFTFSVIKGNDSHLEQQVAVSMSPEHATQVHELLGRYLKEYEDKFGPIRPSPDFKEIGVKND